MIDRADEAQQVLADLSDLPADHPDVTTDINYLVFMVNHEAEVQQSVSAKEIFSNGKQQTWRRILLGAGTPFFQQIGGMNVIAYYLPIVLERSFGMTDRLALILSAVDSMSLMFWGTMAAFLIDRIGRKRLLLWGVACSGVCFALVAIGLRYSGHDNSNKGMSIFAVVFIFMYYVFYGMSLLSIPYMYPAETNSQRMRNIGTSIATAVNWICVYIVVLVTPTAINNIG
jgi:MFS family permease